MASAAPTTKPIVVLPNRRVERSSKTDSAKMAVIGPNMMALGELDFIRAQISPARQYSPRFFRLQLAEIKMIGSMAVRILPLKGILIVYRKLPRTISDAAHVVPIRML